MMTEKTVNVTTTRDIYCKPTEDKTKAVLGRARWQVQRLTIAQFITHVLNGYAYNVSVFKSVGNRKDQRIANFDYSQLIGIDIDGGNYSLFDLQAVPFIQKYAMLIHSTPSSKPEGMRWRVLFCTDNVIRDGATYADYVLRVHAHIGRFFPEIDHSTKDSARLFYGNDLTPRGKSTHKEYSKNENARLPIAVLDGLPRASANGKKPRASSASGDGKEKITHDLTPLSDVMSDEAFTQLVDKLPTRAQNALKKLIVTRKGRNTQLYTTARIFNDCLVSSDTAYPILHRACVANGYIAKDGLQAFQSSFLSAYGNLPRPRSGNRQSDEDISYLNKMPIVDDFGRASNVMTVAHPYITQIADTDLQAVLNHRLVMVKSPTGSGKSTLQGRIIKFWAGKLGFTPRVLVITHRRALVHEIAKRLGFITYADITNPSLRGVDTTIESNVTTFDSLWRYEGANFDLVMIDEAVQALEHLSSSNTLKADRISPLRVLEGLMKTARQTLAFDANFTDSAGRWLENILSAHTRSSVRLVNITRPHARPLDIWHDRSAFLARVFASARVGFTTLACTSVNDARIVNTLATGAGLKTLLVCSDNSDNADVKAKIANINALTDIDLLIYSPSLGTGIDITRPVNGAYLMARPRPLSGDDMVQMLSRARHAGTYGAYGVMRGDVDTTPLTSGEILQDLLQITRATLGTLPDTENGDFLSSARLYATLQADKERQFADVNAFVKSAIVNGFVFGMSYATGRNDALDNAFKQALADDKAWRKETALTIAPLSDEDIETLRKVGNMSYSAKMANLRWHIEYMTGVGINDELYDALYTPEKRARVNRLTDMLATDDEVKNDNAQMNHGRAYQDILPRNVQRGLFYELMSIMGYSTIVDLRGLQNVTREELITPALEAWLNRNRIVIRQAFKRYRQTDNPLTELRAFLRAYGLKLASNQVRRGDDFIMVYSIDTSSLDEALELAEMVLRAARARARERVQNADATTTAKCTHTPPRTSHTPFRGVKKPHRQGRDASTSPLVRA